MGYGTVKARPHTNSVHGMSISWEKAEATQPVKAGPAVGALGLTGNRNL
jgi:hypothetical protein